jgi:hypothetical protein
MASTSEIETMIVERLAKQKGTTPAAMASELAAQGSNMPVDSHRLVRVVFKLARELGVPKFKWDKKFKPAFKSVTLMARFLHDRQPATAAKAA